jgi:hypothetical protein
MTRRGGFMNLHTVNTVVRLEVQVRIEVRVRGGGVLLLIVFAFFGQDLIGELEEAKIESFQESIALV